MKKTLLNVFVAIFACFSFATVMTSCNPEEEVKAGDATALKALIEECQTLADAATTADYPQEAIDAFNKVLNAAKAVAGKEDATQAQLDAAAKQLEEAKKTFLASAYGAIPEEALLLGLSFDEGQGDELTAAGAKGLKVALKASEDAFKAEAVKPTFVDGVKGKAAYFKKGAYMEVARDVLGKDFEGSKLSIATWIKIDEAKENYIVSYNTWNSWKLNIPDHGKPMFTVTTNAEKDACVDMDNEADQSVKAGQWAHLVITVDLETKHEVSFYVDGVNTKTWNSETKPGLAGTAIKANEKMPFFIGISNTFQGEVDAANAGGRGAPTPETWNSYLEGALDELKIYNIALEEGQVAKLYNDEKGK